MRSRVAEIDQNAVAHVPTDEAVERGDHPGDGPVICGDDLAQILGIEARRQRCRANKITEHYRELSAFGIGWRRCFPRYRRLGDGGRLGAECSDSVEQSPTMADRHYADLPEIVGRQAGQHPFVNLVCAKRRLVLLEPETTEPCRNVHARLPEAFNAALLPYPKLSLRTNTWDALSRLRPGIRHGAVSGANLTFDTLTRGRATPRLGAAINEEG